MPGRALQVVRDCVVVFEAEVVADHLGDDRCDAAQLGVAECIPGAGLGEELAVFVLRALR